jgi:hypothetical protein
MLLACPQEVAPPIPATTLLLDIRNFTPNLNAAKADARGINGFCHFLSAFYARCLTASLLALQPGLRLQPPLHETLLALLTADPAHLAEVRDFLHGYGGSGGELPRRSP